MFIVDWDADAVHDFEDVKNRADRRAVHTAIDKLVQLGPKLPPPHVKSLDDQPDLMELRPRQGACDVRPIYAREGAAYIILAVAATHGDLGTAAKRARARLKRRARS